MKRKKIFVIALLIAAILLGFLREYIFVSINHVIESGGNANGNLSILKWVLTFLFTLLYFALTCGFLFMLFREKKHIRLAVFVYAVLVGVSFIAAVTGFLIASFDSVYPFIRTVMGIAQSPIVMMVLIPACLLNEAKLLHKKG